MSAIGHILIIDDELSLRQTLARILQRAGFDVTTAANGEEGLGLLSGTHFDIVYMDIRMPGMAGLDVLQLIHARQPSLPVIMFTAQPDLNSAVEALRRGATDYLLKPLMPQALIDRTRSLIASQLVERRKREILAQIESLKLELQNLESNGVVQPAAILPETSDRYLKRGGMTFDLHTRRLTISERSINMAPTTFDYLLVLARHTPGVVGFQTLVAEAQGYQAEVHEAQELTKWHIHQIRQAIEPDLHHPIYVINVRGSGYRLVVD
jgi:two-component system alkaline phosphatase synthesis response regulator PhoP